MRADPLPYQQNDYLGWYVPRVMAHDGSLNLHASGVRPVDLAALRPPDLDAWAAGPAFEAALAEWLGLRAEELLYLPGATGGTLHVLLSLCRPGATLLVESPIYEPMRRQAERLGPVRRLRRRAERGWRFDLEEADALLDADTACVLLTEPHNPSGVFAPREDILALADLAARHGAFLLVNEVYRGWSDRPSLHGAAPNVLVVSSLSKLFGAYALRLGWVSGPPEVVARLRRSVANTGRPSAPSALAGVALLQEAPERLIAARRRAARMDTVDAWVRATPGLSWVRPQGPGFGLVALPAGTDDRRFVEALHRDHGVLAVPGSLWESPGAVRLGWLQIEAADLELALGRVAEALAAATGESPP